MSRKVCNAALRSFLTTAAITNIISNPYLIRQLYIVEDQPQGYPQFAAVIGSHPSFHVCRRFATIRARLLLLKQDRIVTLEAQLRQVDRREPRPLFLGSARRDGNAERVEVMAALETALADYGMFFLLFCVSCRELFLKGTSKNAKHCIAGGL